MYFYSLNRSTIVVGMVSIIVPRHGRAAKRFIMRNLQHNLCTSQHICTWSRAKHCSMYARLYVSYLI